MLYQTPCAMCPACTWPGHLQFLVVLHSYAEGYLFVVEKMKQQTWNPSEARRRALARAVLNEKNVNRSLKNVNTPLDLHYLVVKELPH